MSRDQERERASADHTVVESDEQAPGRANRCAALSRPHAPVPSGLLLRKGAGAPTERAEAAVSQAGTSGGDHLPDELRGRFERSLGTDLSSVRVHTGVSSHDATSAVGARAYALGDDIHFGAGEYDPASNAGQHLIAHEVAHTVQQRGGSTRAQHKLQVSSAGDAFEVEADRAAEAMVGGTPFALTGASVGLARKEAAAPPAEASPEDAAAEPASGPTQAERDEARAYYEQVIGQSLAVVQRLDAELAALEASPPDPERPSVFGPEADKKMHAQRKAVREAQKADLLAGNGVIAGNQVLLDDPDPNNQAKGVNRAAASKAVYNASAPLSAVQVLLTGAGKSSQTTVVERQTAYGVGETHTTKTTSGVDLKKGTYETGTSESTTVKDGAGSRTVTDEEKVVVGPGSVTASSSQTEIEGGQLTKTSRSETTTAKDGRLGKESSVTYARGTESGGELGEGSTTSGAVTRGVSVTDEGVGADAGVRGTRETQTDGDNKRSTTAALDGKVTLSIERTAEGAYTATITFSLSGSFGVGREMGKEGESGAKASGSYEGAISGSQTRVITIPLSEADVEAYKGDFQAAAGGAATSKPGLHYVQLLATKGDAALVEALSGGSEGARAEGLGYEQTDTLGVSAGTGASASPGPDGSVGVTAKGSLDRSVKFSHTPKPGDPDTLIVTISVSETASGSLGATATSGASTGGVSVGSKTSSGRTFAFEMPNDAELVAQLGEIETPEEAEMFAADVASGGIQQGIRTGKGDSLTTTAGVGPLTGSFTRGGESGETVVRDENGEIVHTDVYGRNKVEGSAAVGPVTLGSHQEVDELTGRVYQDGRAELDLDKSRTTKEMSADELQKNLSERPVGTVVQILTGSPDPYLATKTETTEATKLTHDDLADIQAAAESDDNSRWVKAVGGDGASLEDWNRTRQKIREAKGDRVKIAKALAEFEDSQRSGRSDTIRGLGVGRYTASWPTEIAKERASFERLASDALVPGIKALWSTKGISAALIQVGRDRTELQRVLGVLRAHSDKFEDPAVLGEMTGVLGKRASELHELERELSELDRAGYGDGAAEDQTASEPAVMSEGPRAAPSVEEEAATKRAEARASMAPDLEICTTLRQKENETLGWVEAELAKKGNWIDKPDYTQIFPALNKVKATWPGWKQAVERIRSALERAGDDPSTAATHGPATERWHRLNDAALEER